METAAAIATVFETIADYTVKPVGRQVGYLIHYKSKLRNLKAQLENLAASRDRTQHEVDEGKRRGKRVETDVQNWLARVDEITREGGTFLQDQSQARTKCLYGICPNPIPCHQFGRKSTKFVEKIEKLLQEKSGFSAVCYNAPVEEICGLPSKDYMAFESRTSTVNDILEELRNPDTNRIGVYGLPGIGKTTLAKEVFRRAKMEKLFDDDAMIIIINVKEKKDLETLQKEIVEKLGMDPNESESMGVRASRLWDRIKDKKTLVILDDVSERIDLKDLGVLCGPTCCVLLTSRDHKAMDVEKFFKLSLLEEEDTWSLFEKMAGDAVKDDRIRKVAKQVANKCGGLPVSIVAVGRALRRTSNLARWKDTLRGFKNFSNDETKTAFEALEWSYNQLKSEELKSFFLLCGIHAQSGRTVSLSDLLKYTMGLGLVRDVNTVEETRTAVHSLVEQLKDSCLLLDSFGDSLVCMHDLVQDVCVEIAYRDQHVLSRAYENLEEWPNLEECSRVSLRGCTISKLPEVTWECPKLKMFYLENRATDDLLDIPSNFFDGMKELKVLDLTRHHLPSLPSSIRFLANLQTLCLDGCVLEDIALVGELTHLKILSLLDSTFKQLPKEIGQLTRLQLLDLTRCSELVQIAPNVISSLASLEDLRIGINSFKQWESEGFIDGKSNASVSELRPLSKLTALEIHISNATVLPENLFSNQLERYIILVGDCWTYPDRSGTSSNILKLKLSGSMQFDQGIKFLLKSCEQLYLDGKEVVNIISHLLQSDGVKQLKHLHVQNSDEVTHAINWSYSHNHFSNLESLSLDNLPSLQAICYGQPEVEPFQKLGSLMLRNLPNLIGFSSKGSMYDVTTRTHKQITSEEIILENEIGGPKKHFMDGEVQMPNLTRLELHGCDGLKCLFSSSMARCLMQLEQLEISRCQNMEEIVAKSDSSEEYTEKLFSKLWVLRLQYLPSLARFCTRSHIEFPSLKVVDIKDCVKLGPFVVGAESESTRKEDEDGELKETDIPNFLFDEKVAFPSLKILELDGLPNLVTIWPNQPAPDSSFCKLRVLAIFRCPNLINIFVPNIMGRLNALETLRILECQAVQVVFQIGAVDANREASTSDLCLDTVEISQCESLKNVFPSAVAKGLHRLSSLCVDKCGTLEEIVAKEGGPETTPEFVFPKVTKLTFNDLPQLKSFYRGPHIAKWPLLKELSLFDCANVEIFAAEVTRFFEGKHESRIPSTVKEPFFLIDKVAFPCLETLNLDRLPNLMTIWPNQLAPDSFCKLRELNVTRCQSLMNIFVPSIIGRLNALETLRILECQAIQVVFEIGAVDVNREASTSVVAFPSLEILKLDGLPNLVTIWPNQIGAVDANREASTSDLCLDNLEISQCESLKNVFPSAVAKGLQRLRRLFVVKCGILEEIVAKEGGPETTPEFVFPKVEELTFQYLPQLKSFYRGPHIARWPLLKKLSFFECDNVEIFAAEVTTRFKGKQKESTIPSTVKEPFFLIDKGSFPNLEQLHLPTDTEIWYEPYGLLPPEFFSKLKTLVVGRAYPKSVDFIQRLHSLEELGVVGAPWKGIFVYQGNSSARDTHVLGTFSSRVKILKLGKMDELVHLGNDLVFPNSEILFVCHCERLPNLTSSLISFGNLIMLHVCDSHRLKYLITYSVAKCLQQLRALEVNDCKSMTEIVVSSGGDDDDSENEIVFSRLQLLNLSGLPLLQSFCRGNCTVRVPCLDNLNVSDCLVKLETSPDGVLSNVTGSSSLQMIQNS